MAETFFRSISLVPNAITEKAIVITETFVECTWSVVLVTLLLTYCVFWMLRWQWRLGDYKNRYVLVTGCDTGFGHELVKRLDEMGFHVFAGCLTSHGLESVTKATSRRVMPVSLDVTDIDNIAQVVDYMNSKIPPGLDLWAVVNNAGVMNAMAPIELTPTESFRRTLEVNLLGTVEVTRACLPLVRRSRGRVINMSSVSGRLGFTAIDYTASKFAVEGFTDCLRREVARDGVTVVSIAPGGFQTSLCNFDKIFSYMQQVLDSLPSEVQQHLGKEYVINKQNLFDTCSRYLGWGSTAIQSVVDVYVHALTARFPRTRYVVGMDAVFFFQPLWYLPDWMVDPLFSHWPLCRLLR